MKVYFSVFLISLLTSVALGFIFIPILKRLKIGQSILNYVTEHNYKSGTPTMGGVIFVISAIASFYAFFRSEIYLASVCIVVGVSYMGVGFLDDYLKIRLKHNKGLSGWQKTFFEVIIAIIIAIFAYRRGLTRVYIPFTDVTVNLKGWYIPLCIFTFLATTNSVNLTDGLDGLAGGVSYLFTAFLGAIILLQMNRFSNNYNFYGEYEGLSALCFALSGGVVGFLLFNTHKATVFMGDTGSLSLGGFIAIISIVSGNLLFIPIIGITFVMSSISVIMQVIYFKRTGKRIFLMSPLHHHFQQRGYEESKIAVGYKIVTVVMGLLCTIPYA